MGSIFGGSKQSSTSSNRAYDTINQSFSPLFNQAQQGATGLAALLGGDTSGFDQYKDATGFDFAAQEGSKGVLGNAAARGLLRSGSTSKSLVNFGNQLQQQYAGNYMDRLLGQAALGMQAGQLVAGAGQQSQSKGKSKPGLGGLIGGALSGVAASDRRLKTNIVKIGTIRDGLNLYEFNYIDGSGPHVGVMADEVAEVLPEALGPTIDGYGTVDYDKLEELA